MSSIIKVDKNGRLCLPKSMRIKADMKQSGLLTAEVEDNKIILEKCKTNIVCDNCGTIIEKEDSYCRNCGKSMEVENGKEY